MNNLNMIPENHTQEIKDVAQANIIHIVSDWVKLKRNGSSYQGLCPFHNERTPSFSVSKTRGMYKCFGCDKSGDAIQFVMEQGRLSFMDAIQWVARRYNIAISVSQGDQVPKSVIAYKRPSEIREPEKIDFIPPRYMLATMGKYKANGFLIGMARLFGQDVADAIAEKYMVGTSKKYQENGFLSTVFWQVDINQNIRQCNVVLYNPITLKRSRNENMRPKKYGRWVSEEMEDKNLECCFFGEHLLKEHPERMVCIVESEKTAIICSLFYPQYNWLATSGTTGIKWKEKRYCEVLHGKTVKLFPDAGEKNGIKAYRLWNEQAALIAGMINCNISVSDLIERKATTDERAVGYDLADYLLSQCPQTGLALTDHGYPVMWDIKT